MSGLTHEFHDGVPDAPLLLLLHGTGGGPGDLVRLAREISPGSPLLAPLGPVSENGAARWFRRLAEGVFDHEDVVARTGQLAEFVTAARQEHGVADRRVVAVGFSNGANIAAALALLRPEVLDEAVLFSAMLPLPESPQRDLSGSRVLLSGGQRDPMAPMVAARDLVAVLRDRGAEVTEHWHEGGHQITFEAIDLAKRWISAPPR